MVCSEGMDRGERQYLLMIGLLMDTAFAYASRVLV